MPEKGIWKTLPQREWRKNIIQYLKKQQLNTTCADIIMLNVKIQILYKKALFFLKRKFLSRQAFYPPEIKKIIKKTTNKNYHWRPLALEQNLLSLFEERNCLQLAGTEINIDDYSKPHELKFSDNEDYLSFHRWGWLIKNFNNDHKKLINIIEDWVEKNADKRDKSVWDAYSCAERICNGVLFYDLAKRRPSNGMVQSFGFFAENIIDNLEYYDQFTNNHILNDARGLFFAGCYLDNEYYKELASAIIKRELPIHITQEGFLREGSSHYHFLITKWITEILWLANIEKNELAIFIKSWVEKLNQCCNFFLTYNKQTRQYEMPLIGDISPDFTPEWLIRHYLMNNNLVFLNNYKEDNKKSGWYRFNFQDIALFIKTATISNSHAHNDIGTFVLYVNNEPVLIDSGRMDYTDSKKSNYGLSVAAHNSVLVDNRDYFHSKSSYFKPEIEWTFKDGGLYIGTKLLAIKGLRRLVLIRNFLLKKGIFEIEDWFDGRGQKILETRFHFAPKIKAVESANKKSYSLVGHFGKGEFVVDRQSPVKIKKLIGNENNLGGWYFPEYGKGEISTTLSFQSKIKLPTRIKYQLILNQ